jgi:ParB family transcriptional regulator, chromosome partitioning protein
MTTSNAAAVDKTTATAGTEKVHEKLAEKRRALGRGLESLLPGPRVVPASAGLPQSPRKDADDGASAGSQGPVAGSRDADAASSSSSFCCSFFCSSSALSLRFVFCSFAFRLHLLVLSSGAGGGRAGTPDAPLDVDAVSETLSGLQASASGPAWGQNADGEAVLLLETDQIDHNPYQTRREFDPEALKELARSIDVQGLLQPVVVRPGTEGRFILIVGERRLRASKLAGKQTIPAIVKRVSEQQAAEMTLVENLQRRDLNCVEQAEAFSNLSKDFKMTQEEIGKRAGVSREQVSNYMRLLLLPESVIGALQTGKLTYSHARTLLHLRDNTEIWKFAKRAMEEKMSVARLEDLVLGMSAPPGASKTGGGARWMDPNVKAAQRSLEEVLGMRVRIRDRNGRGRF